MSYLAPQHISFEDVDHARPDPQPDGPEVATLHQKANAPPIVFVMLGVVPYAATNKLLEIFGRIAANAAEESEIVFDNTEPLDKAPAEVRANYEAAAKRVEAGGEPRVTFLEPDALQAALRERGFANVTDIDAATLSRRFCAGRTDGLSIAPLAHLLRART